MRIHYFHDDYGNFGDDLNLWLWPRILPGASARGPDPLLLGIGTVLGNRVPSAPVKVVLGAGVGYGDPPALDDRWHFYAVRGPDSAAALGLPPQTAITDAAALLARLLPPGRRTGPTGFMPHHRSRHLFNWPDFCTRLGLVFLDPWAPVARTLRQIGRCRSVMAEAMHAAIVADALRVPWIPVVFYPHINEFKWKDWCASLELDYSPIRLNPLYDLHRNAPHLRLADYARRVRRTRSLTRYGPWALPAMSERRLVEQVHAVVLDLVADQTRYQLSSDAVPNDRVTRLVDAARRVRTDWMSPAAP